MPIRNKSPSPSQNKNDKKYIIVFIGNSTDNARNMNSNARAKNMTTETNR
jgi:hypothetical protein